MISSTFKINSGLSYFKYLIFALLMGTATLSHAVLELEDLQGLETTNEKVFQPLGIHVGSFYFYPAIEVGIKSSSNVFRLPEGLELSDTIRFAKVSASLNSDWNRHSLVADVYADNGYYKKYDSENYQRYGATLNGNYDVQNNSFATGRLGYKRRYKDRGSIDDRGQREPTKYNQSYIGAGYDHMPNRLRVLTRLYYENLDFKNSESILGDDIDNSDRDRGRTEGTFRLGYENLPARRIFIEGILNTVDYDQQFDKNGIERSSNGYKVKFGMNFDLTALLVGDLFIGYLNQDYDDTSYPDLSAPLLGFNLSWHPTGLTTIHLNLDRNPGETTIPTASGYLRTTFSIKADHELLRNLLVSASFVNINKKYNQIVPGRNETDDIYRAGIGLNYFFNRRYFVAANYIYERRKSDIETRQYTLNRGLLSLGANW